ncbi:hypothetical protein ACMFMG_009545 [Clarireedia jacksonii]
MKGYNQPRDLDTSIRFDPSEHFDNANWSNGLEDSNNAESISPNSEIKQPIYTPLHPQCASDLQCSCEQKRVEAGNSAITGPSSPATAGSSQPVPPPRQFMNFRRLEQPTTSPHHHQTSSDPDNCQIPLQNSPKQSQENGPNTSVAYHAPQASDRPLSMEPQTIQHRGDAESNSRSIPERPAVTIDSTSQGDEDTSINGYKDLKRCIKSDNRIWGILLTAVERLLVNLAADQEILQVSMLKDELKFNYGQHAARIYGLGRPGSTPSEPDIIYLIKRILRATVNQDRTAVAIKLCDAVDEAYYDDGWRLRAQGPMANLLSGAAHPLALGWSNRIGIPSSRASMSSKRTNEDSSHVASRLAKRSRTNTNSTTTSSNDRQNRYWCYCTSGISHRNGIIRHIRTHHPVEKYRCPAPGCPQEFTRKDSVKSHHSSCHHGQNLRSQDITHSIDLTRCPKVCFIKDCPESFQILSIEDYENFEKHILSHYQDKDNSPRQEQLEHHCSYATCGKEEAPESTTGLSLRTGEEDIESLRDTGSWSKDVHPSSLGIDQGLHEEELLEQEV